MDKMRALVVDDEQDIRFFLQEVLANSGFDVTSAASGEEALQYLRDRHYNLVILDLRLGGRVDGMRLLSAARWRWPGTAVMILTAHGSLETAMEAIREGIDGYLLKPVEPEELRQAVNEAIERRRALAQPTQEPEQSVLRCGALTVHVDKHLVLRAGKEIELTPQEFRFLVYLLENPNRVITPKELVRVIREFEPDSTFEAREIIKWYVHTLRKKVEADPANPQFIINVRGVGYRLGKIPEQ